LELRLELGESFVTETVFSDSVGAKLAWLARAKQRGFETYLIFVGISDPALSEARVIERASARGGHDAPRAKLYQRYPRTLANLEKALPIVDTALLLDNDDDRLPYRPIALFRIGKAAWRAAKLPRWVPNAVKTALRTIPKSRPKAPQSPSK
jgi:predicted ABC-type ATPase